MSLRVAIQMDPIAAVNIDGDSTFRMAEEAQARGHALFYYHPEALVWREGRVLATGWDLTVRRRRGDHFTLGERRQVDQRRARIEPRQRCSYSRHIGQSAPGRQRSIGARLRSRIAPQPADDRVDLHRAALPVRSEQRLGRDDIVEVNHDIDDPVVALPPCLQHRPEQRLRAFQSGKLIEFNFGKVHCFTPLA